MASFSNFKSTIVQASQTAAGVATGVTVYANTDALPYVGNSDGDQAYVSSNNRLYIWQGSGWYNVALINRAPAISAVQDSDGNTTPFALAIDGTVTTITITAADSDGDPITYSATADSDFNGLASITNNGNEFTITPFSSDSATTESGTITFKATDGVNIASSGVQTFTLNFLSALWSDVVLSIGMADSDGLDNSTFIDRSTNAHTVTPTGSPVQTAFHPYLDNWSVEFDGTANNIPYIANNAAFNVAGGDYTIEFWFYGDGGISGTRQVMFSTYDNPSGGIIFNWLGDNTFSCSLSGDGYDITSTETITFNEWHHGAIVSNSGTVTLYLDGVSVGTTTNSTVNGVRPLVIGCLYNDFNNTWILPFSGYISNLRIIKGTALYTANFTPPTEKLTAVANTTVLTCQSNRFVETASDLTFTFRGNPAISAFNPFGQGSEYAAGENKGATLFNSSSKLTADSPAIPATDDFFLQGWVYPNTVSSRQNIFSQYAPSPAVGRLALEVGQTAGTFTFFTPNTSTLTFSANANEWFHFAVSREGTTFKLFKNGVQEDTATSSESMSQQNAIVGATGSTYTGMDGYISDIKVTTGSAGETSAFTPPTAPVGNTNASLYLPMDNAGIYDKTGNNILTLVGNVSTSTAQTKYANTSIYFDGTGDGLAVEDNPKLFAFGTSDFTIEMWVYVNAFTNQYSILYASRPVSTNGPYVLIPIENDGKVYLYTQTAVRITSSPGTITTGQWYHIALCRSGSNSKLFVDGTQVGSTYVDTNNYDNPAGRPTIGSDSYFADLGTNSLNGYIENLQVLNGVAKYTSNFTVPSQEQGRTYQAED